MDEIDQDGIDSIIDRDQFRDEDPALADALDELKEKSISDVLNKLLKSDYSHIVADAQKLFTQELKTGNLDGQDIIFCNKAFQLISMIRSYNVRYSTQNTEKSNEFVKQLLIEVYSRISLSNSKNGSFIELMLKNISERTYTHNRNKGIGGFLRR